eukprot:2327419-Rhodomonas_salina.1
MTASRHCADVMTKFLKSCQGALAPDDLITKCFEGIMTSHQVLLLSLPASQWEHSMSKFWC